LPHLDQITLGAFEVKKGERKMKNKLAVLMLLILVLSTIPIALRVEHVYASPSGPSLVVNDSINRVNATIGVKAGSVITAKGVITNIGPTTLTNMLVGVYFIEGGGGGGALPADFSFEYSLDGIVWMPITADTYVAKPAAAPYQVEQPIGQAGGETLVPGVSILLYLRITFNADLDPIKDIWTPDLVIQSMQAWAYQDLNLNRQFDGSSAGEYIYSQPPYRGGASGANWDYPIKIDISVVHTAEIEGTGKFYYNIQDAINAASPGDTIIVYDGTYDEQIVINKSLTIQGGSTPIIKPSSAAILTTVLDGFFWGSTKQIAGIIVANAAGGSVTVKNIIVDGENIATKPTGADYVAGIFYRETGGTIDTVTVANITIGSTGTAVRGYGIYLSAIANDVSIEVKGSTLENYDKNGIDAHGNRLTVNIHDNTLTGRGPLPSGDEVQNGILIMDGAMGTVNSNTISDMAYIPETWWCAGIMFYSSGCSAASNTITDTQIGIIFQDASGSAETNTVAGGAVGLLGLWAQYTEGGTWTISFVGNTISGAKDSSGYENAAIGAQTYDGTASLTVTIDNNQLTGDGSTTADGIYIGDVPAASPAGTITPIIRGNVISGWQNGIRLESSVDTGNISNNNIDGTYLGILVRDATSVQINNNRITDFVKGGIVTRGVQNILVEENIIGTTIHDEAPNGIDIGTYSGTKGTIRENKISGCSWNGFTGDYETSWSGSGILVIESGDSLEIIGNTVHDCDVGMDIESDSMNITCNEVHNNIYGFVFWNAKPKVNYNNIYSNTQYGVYRTISGDLAGMLDARYNWWGHASGPTHPSNPGGTGDKVSDYVWFSPWLFTEKVPPLVHDVALITVPIPTTYKIQAGTTIQVDVPAENKGTAYENFTVTLYYDSTTIGTKAITDLGPGETQLLTFNWDTTGVVLHKYYILKATASTVPGETNTADNTNINPTPVLVGFFHTPTLKVEPAIVPDKILFVNETFKVNITMNNLSEDWHVAGAQVVLSFNTTLIQVVDVTEGTFFSRFKHATQLTVSAYFVEGSYVALMVHLSPNENGTYPEWPRGDGVIATITFKVMINVPRGSVASCALTICNSPYFDTMLLDHDMDKIAFNIESGTCRILGTNLADINYDGIVDIQDLARVSAAFGSYIGHPRYNAECDINKDGRIDIQDVARVSSQFGWYRIDP